MSENTQNSQNNEEYVNSLIERESDRVISLIRMNNMNQGSSLTLLTKDQKNMLVSLVREFYFKKINSINVKNNDLELIFYNPFIHKFAVPLTEELSDGTKIRTYINLSNDQFIRAIIHAIIIGIFKLDNTHQFFSLDNNTSVLTVHTDDSELKKNYPYVTGKIYLEMIMDKQFAKNITYLAARVGTDELQLDPVLMEINQKIGPPAPEPEPDEITGHLPIPPIPPGGWPLVKRGGKKYRKTNRKRKYKSNSHSKSKKRRYKSRFHRKK